MTINKEDVLRVVSELNQVLSEDEVTELIKRYNECEPTNVLDPWYIIVEDLMYNIIDERELLT